MLQRAAGVQLTLVIRTLVTCAPLPAGALVAGVEPPERDPEGTFELPVAGVPPAPAAGAAPGRHRPTSTASAISAAARMMARFAMPLLAEVTSTLSCRGDSRVRGDALLRAPRSSRSYRLLGTKRSVGREVAP